MLPWRTVISLGTLPIFSRDKVTKLGMNEWVLVTDILFVTR